MDESPSLDRVLLLFSNGVVEGKSRLFRYGFLLSRHRATDLKEIADIHPNLKFYDDWKSLYRAPYSSKLEADLKAAIENKLIHKGKLGGRFAPDRYLQSLRGRVRWRTNYREPRKNINAVVKYIGKMQERPIDYLMMDVDRLSLPTGTTDHDT